MVLVAVLVGWAGECLLVIGLVCLFILMIAQVYVIRFVLPLGVNTCWFYSMYFSAQPFGAIFSDTTTHHHFTLHYRHHATPWLRNSSEDDYQGLADDGPLLIDDEDSELGSNYNSGNANTANHGDVHGVHTTHSYNYSTSPNNIENMRLTPPGSPERVRRDTSGGSGMGGVGSNTNSPRKVRGKSSFHIGSLNTAVNSDNSGPASPVDKRHTNTTNHTHSANTNNNKNTMSNWLGKNIFGSFKADHSQSNNNSTYDEHQGLLNQGTTNIGNLGGTNHKDNFGLDISVIEQGGHAGSDSGNNSPTTNANNARYVAHGWYVFFMLQRSEIYCWKEYYAHLNQQSSQYCAQHT